MSAASLPLHRSLRIRRKVALRLILAFVLMLGLALSLLVRITEAVVAPPQDEVPPATELRVPVSGVDRAQIADSWGQARDAGARPHQGTDIMAPEGTTVIAAAAGVVEKLFDSATGGHTLYIRSPDRHWSYYYAHLAGYAPGIAVGKTVRAGDAIALVGDTGNAGAGNYHLHFGISRMGLRDGWWEGQAINPYPVLVPRTARR
jgi:murein DD-endopeptidase MepM/ murein hydrolase activator NlpD